MDGESSRRGVGLGVTNDEPSDPEYDKRRRLVLVLMDSSFGMGLICGLSNG